ncbi:MAG: hypothetical protein STSR0007_12300 [Thermovirga sp.]
MYRRLNPAVRLMLLAVSFTAFMPNLNLKVTSTILIAGIILALKIYNQRFAVTV